MITINLDKARLIAHAKRRAARAEEFKPHDDAIAKRLPDKDVDEAENARVAIRAKYAALQIQMDEAQNVDDLKALLPLEPK